MTLRFTFSHLCLVTASTLGLVACASAYSGGHANGVLTDGAGMTVYVFDKDAAHAGTSACIGPCAAKWPPVPGMAMREADTGGKHIVRPDGTHQATRDGRPLYYFAGDRAAGDRNGDGMGGVWHAITEAASPSRATHGQASTRGSDGY